MSGRNQECDIGLGVGSDVVAQHLFLGSSVSSFNSNVGWGGSTSTLTVELVNDIYGGCHKMSGPLEPIFKWKQGDYSADNHYYTCRDNNCYIDEKGFPFDPEREETRPDGPNVPQPSKQRIVPGKVYHVNSPNGLVSRYWRFADPGFFGQATRIGPNGAYNNALNPSPTDIYRYDLIGVPAYFRFGYFTFGGIITSWECNNRTTTPTYSVTLSSAESMLKNCKVILSKYAGSVFTKFGNFDFAGSPTNYTGWLGNYRGLLREGNLANVFNIYGFLESYGFGTSNANEQGVPLSYILDSLSVLTSVTPPQFNQYKTNLSNLFPSIISQQNSNNKLGFHSAFSPFGRIVCPTMMTDDKIDPKPFLANEGSAVDYSFGIMKPTIDEFNIPRVEFLLDLSEVPRPPIDVRYNGVEGVASITDIIEAACEKTGRDWYTTIIRKNGLNFIKVKTVDRTFSVPTNTVESIVKTLESASPAIPVVTSSFGKEKNDSATPRVMYIGANQQRLFQTKSYLLGYSNTHLVYHPILKKFVDYYRLCQDTSDTNGGVNSSGLEIQDSKGNRTTSRSSKTQASILSNNKGNKWLNSYRLPMAYSTRNIALSNLLNGPLVTELFANEQALAGNSSAVSTDNTEFEKPDPFAQDTPIGGKTLVRVGNYWNASIETMCNPEWFRDANILVDATNLGLGCSTVSLNNKPRYIPLWLSSISPFFGYANDQLVPATDDKGANIYRFVRPVYLDTWSGLLVVGFRSNELPLLSMGMLPVFYAKTMAPSPSNTSGSGISSAGAAGPVPGAAPGDPPVDPASSAAPSTPPASGTSTPSPPPTASPDNNTTNPFDSSGSPYQGTVFNTISFVVTETEFRAAMVGWEEYLAYCLLKMPYSKPDLFTMLVKTYQFLGKLTVSAAPGALNNSGTIQSGKAAGTVNVGGGHAPGTVGNGKVQAIDALNLNFNWVLNPDFINDWKRITNFVKDIGNKYYGRSYLVKVPEVLSYRDYQYADLQLPVMAETSTLMFVYQGSGKIYFNYEIADYAWEEPGNYIDDRIIVGSPDYYKLCNENGQIPPILGYNANPVKDYMAEKWCAYQSVTKIDKWKKSNLPEAERYRTLEAKVKSSRGKLKSHYQYLLKKLETTVIGTMLYNCSTIMVPSLDLENQADQPYVLTMGPDAGREDAYSNMTIGTPIMLQDGDKILDPTNNEAIYEVELVDDQTTGGVDESKEVIERGSSLPIPTIKAYFAAECQSSFTFLDPLRLRDPRAVVSAPGLDLYSSSLSYTKDPTQTVIANMAAEDLGILENMVQKAVTNNQAKEFRRYITKISQNFKWYLNGQIVEEGDECGPVTNLRRILLGLFSILDDEGYLLTEDNTSNQSPKHYAVAARKAHPFFAAVPLVDNVASYGPWTNYPMIADQRVYSGYTLNARQTLVEQMINNTDVVKNSEWCPWNYGGMSFLDREIINEIDAKATYQMSLENALLNTNGMPLFNMSGGLRIKVSESDVYGLFNQMFMNYTYYVLYTVDYISYGGLTLSNISTSVSDRSITTSYRFQTYSPKLGLFNKEISDRNKLSAKIKIEFANKIAIATRNINNKLTTEFIKILKENSSNRDFSKNSGDVIAGGLYDTSPIQYLVGSASYLVPWAGLPYCGDPGLNSDAYKKLSDIKKDNLKGECEYLHTIARTKNWVGAFETRESLAELASQFNSKALMSLDAVFSPVSFYPSYNLGTYPISSRFITEEHKKNNVTCPRCLGTSKITYYKGDNKEAIDYPCPLCNKPKLTVKFAQDASNTNPETPPDVNFLTLNPIIMPNGEFQNPNSQALISPFERGRHNIRVIGRQENPQDGDISLDIGDNLNIVVDKTTKISNYETFDADGNITSTVNMHNQDFYQYDLSYEFGDNRNILTNQRFFAFRGPMMLHGWGYDTEGYPVPNQADQPKEFDDKGRPKRFLLTSSGTNDLTKEGKFLPDAGESLGDIIGSGYVMENGEWTRKPTKYFHLNWGERSDLWPIGPIDLRWDRDRQVWVGGGGCGEIDPPFIMASGTDPFLLNNFVSEATANSSQNCPYKMIYIVLEENLFADIGMSDTYPARAFIDDTEYGLEPMPYSIRRLVYVKDRCGYSAPRGAKLLCRYNRDTGFYEPVSKPSFIVFGTIAGGANTAVVELTYIRGIKSAENIPKTNITFDNTRFNFDINAARSRRGMFLFENGKWILTGFN